MGCFLGFEGKCVGHFSSPRFSRCSMPRFGENRKGEFNGRDSQADQRTLKEERSHGEQSC